MDLTAALSLRELLPFDRVALVIINFIAFTLLFTVFYHTHFSDKKGKIFAFMSLSILLWVDFAYLARIFGLYPSLSEFLLRIAWVATPPVFYCVYLMSTHLLGMEKEKKRLTQFIAILSFVLSLLCAVSDLVIEGVKFTGSTLDIIYGNGFFPFLFGVFIIIFATITPLFQVKLKRSALFFIIGVVIFYVLNMVFNITLPVFFNITRLYYFGDYSTVFLLGFTSYAILRHKLFDIEIIATEILTIVMWSVLSFQILFAKTRTEKLVDVSVLLLMILFGFLLIRSVTKEVEQRRELERLYKKLRKIDQRKTEFLNMAAHELRAPLTAIKGYVSMVLDGDTGPIAPQTKEFLEDTQLSNERMIRLVNNLLDVSRIEENRIVYQMEITSLKDIVSTAFNEFKVEADRQKLSFLLDIPDSIVDSVYVDKDRIMEVIVNFVSNALKYTEEGRIAVKLTNPSKDVVRFEVSDTGPGISDEEQQKLFHKFYRVKSTAGKTIGTGLGLYISKLLITTKFSGTIGVISQTGKGSTFWFELPVATKTV